MQPIVTLTLPLTEARELYRAMITRYLMEDTLRREQGLEPVEISGFIKRLEQVLGVQPEHAVFALNQVEDELWQHAWLSFTDEWAWHRARQDIKKELSAEERTKLTAEELETAAEKRYEERFDAYLAEVQLPGHEEGATCLELKSEKVNLGGGPKNSRR